MRGYKLNWFCPAMMGLAILFSLPACLSEAEVKIKADFPRYTVINLNQFPELYLASFQVDQSPASFELNTELLNYLETELKVRYSGRLQRLEVIWPEESYPEDQAFWKNMFGHTQSGPVLTGRVSFKQEKRKTLGSRYYREIDGPFNLNRPALEERLVSTLTVNFYLVQPETGQILFNKKYQENRVVENRQESPAISFYELILIIKNKFFGAVLGTELSEERYLLRRSGKP